MPFKKLIFFCLHTVMNLRLFPASNTVSFYYTSALTYSLYCQLIFKNYISIFKLLKGGNTFDFFSFILWVFFSLNEQIDVPFQCQFQTEEACFQSIPTISIVDHCPKDFSEWMIAKDIKQCYWISQKCTKPERFEYHCLPDRYHKQFIEVCAPTKWIVGKKPLQKIDFHFFQFLNGDITVYLFESNRYELSIL